MKITQAQLKRIIREETSRFLDKDLINESYEDDFESEVEDLDAIEAGYDSVADEVDAEDESDFVDPDAPSETNRLDPERLLAIQDAVNDGASIYLETSELRDIIKVLAEDAEARQAFLGAIHVVMMQMAERGELR